MKERVKKVLERSRNSYKSLPEKKQHVEFFTAILSVPVLLTVILLNVNNLRNTKNTSTAPIPTPVKEIIYISPQDGNTTMVSSKKTDPTSTPAPVCDKSIGPVDIKNPKEDETLTDNPVSVLVNYEQGNHCSVVWAYRINGGRWSDYDDKSIALYNLSNGPVFFELKVKSIVTGEEKTLTRNFTYIGNNTANTATSSAN